MGRAVAETVARSGASVTGIDRPAATANPPTGVRILGCDVSKRAEVEAAFKEAATSMGGIDGLVNCAGIERHCAAATMTDEEWDEVLDVNLRGTFLTNQAVFPYLQERGWGRIVNFGSDSGLVPHVYGAHYSASKGAVIAWSRSIAHEWGRHGITVNTILPAIWTEMYEESRARYTPEQLRAHEASIASRLPVGGKLGDPVQDLAPVVAFLLSDDSRFVTGQLISVTGGLGSTR
jgi:NAD(P)-dependent dehydrogenase (short-subunit alcohol dehydrogenase family)